MRTEKLPVTTLLMSVLMIVSTIALSVPVAAAPQAGISAPSDAGTTAPGATFTVTYEYTNTGDQDASAGRLELSTPTGINATSISGDGASGLSGPTPAVFYGLSGPIAPGDTKTTTVTYTVSSAASSGDNQIDVEAFIQNSSSTATASTTVEVNKPSPVEVDAPASATAQANSTFDVTYEYTNNQSSEASAGRIELQTPQNITATAVSGDGTPGLGATPQSVLYGFSGKIQPGQTLTTTVTFEVASGAASGQEQIVATAYIQGSSDTSQTTTDVTIGGTIVDQFDTNGTPGIQPGEAQSAIAALNGGQISPRDAQAIIAALNSGST